MNIWIDYGLFWLNIYTLERFSLVYLTPIPILRRLCNVFVSTGQIANPMPIGPARARTTSALDFSGAQILPSKKKSINLQIFSRLGKRNNKEKITLNSKYYHKHQRTSNILIKFRYLMVLKLLFLSMDWETINSLDQSRSEV